MKSLHQAIPENVLIKALRLVGVSKKMFQEVDLETLEVQTNKIYIDFSKADICL